MTPAHRTAVPGRPRRQPAAPAGPARRPATSTRPGGSTPPGCARPRTTRSATSCAMQERRRAAVGHRRRVPPHVVAHGLHLPARRDRPHRRAASQVHVAQRGGRHRLHRRRAGRRRAGSGSTSRSSPTTSGSCAEHGDARPTPKLTIPSPSMVHYRGGRRPSTAAVYPDIEQFWADLSAAYADQVRAMAELGCRYLQLDDTSLAYLNDPAQRAVLAARGDDADAPAPALHPPDQRGARRPAGRACGHHPHVPRQLPLLAGRPRAATTSWPRRCSASSTSTASSASSTTSAPAGSRRCGSCRPASWSCSAWSPRRRGALEDKDELKRRIDEAAKYVPLDQLCLSPAVRLLLHGGGQRAHLDEQVRQAAPDRRGREDVWG